MQRNQVKRIAILGTESSHARVFAQLLAPYRDVEIVGAYGEDPSANERLASTCGVDCSATSPEAFCDKVDGVLITARRGSDHLRFALPYLREGMTVFVDKPLCDDLSEAEKLVALAGERHVRLCGGSSLKYSQSLLRMRDLVRRGDVPVIGASLCAPVEMNSPYGGFLFYAPHLIEMALTVFGNGIRSVRAHRFGETVTAFLFYETFCVSLIFGCNEYHVSVSFSTCEKHCSVGNISELYAKELTNFRRLLFDDAGKYASDADLCDHVRLGVAIRRAYESGEEICF